MREPVADATSVTKKVGALKRPCCPRRGQKCHRKSLSGLVARAEARVASGLVARGEASSANDESPYRGSTQLLSLRGSVSDAKDLTLVRASSASFVSKSAVPLLAPKT